MGFGLTFQRSRDRTMKGGVGYQWGGREGVGSEGVKIFSLNTVFRDRDRKSIKGRAGRHR